MYARMPLLHGLEGEGAAAKRGVLVPAATSFHTARKPRAPIASAHATRGDNCAREEYRSPLRMLNSGGFLANRGSDAVAVSTCSYTLR